MNSYLVNLIVKIPDSAWKTVAIGSGFEAELGGGRVVLSDYTMSLRRGDSVYWYLSYHSRAELRYPWTLRRKFKKLQKISYRRNKKHLKFIESGFFVEAVIVAQEKRLTWARD